MVRSFLERAEVNNMHHTWLIETGVQIAYLVCNYLKKPFFGNTLRDFYKHIEKERTAYNAGRPPWECFDQEWHLVEQVEGCSLYFTKEETGDIFVSLFENTRSIFIRIRGEHGDILRALINEGWITIHDYNKECLDPDEQAFLELLEEELGISSWKEVITMPLSNTIH